MSILPPKIIKIRRNILKNYICKFLQTDVYKKCAAPIIVFNHDTCVLAAAILKEENIRIKRITFEKCKRENLAHFPYTCKELKLYHDLVCCDHTCLNESHDITCWICAAPTEFNTVGDFDGKRYIIKLKSRAGENIFSSLYNFEENCPQKNSLICKICSDESRPPRPPLKAKDKARLKKRKDKEKKPVKNVKWF